MALIFREPLVIQQDTGVTVDPNNTELLGATRQTVIVSIGQAVETTSNLVLGQVTTSDRFIIDNGQNTYSNGIVSGSLTLTDNFTTIQNLNGDGDLTVFGTLIAEKIETELSQSVTLFESGSTIFGDTSDDIHQFSGSVFISGSFTLNAKNIPIQEISNDTALTDDSGVAVVTENALKSYLDDNTDDVNTYLRKSFVHTGSFVNSSTSSFTAVTASAPSSLTATGESDFMFFINGQMMEHDALTVQQSGTTFNLHVDTDGIGFDILSQDEIVAWGKFNS